MTKGQLGKSTIEFMRRSAGIASFNPEPTAPVLGGFAVAVGSGLNGECHTARSACAGLATAACLAALLLAGCGGRFVPVEGTVTLDGSPLPNATVVFTPVGPGQPATALTDSQGAFRAATFKAGDGAVPGKYKVTITKTPFVPRGPGFRGPEAEVQAPDPKAMDEAVLRFEQERRKPPEFPAFYSDLNKTPFTADIPAGGSRNLEFALKRTADR